jgi:hypothetical protein
MAYLIEEADLTENANLLERFEGLDAGMDATPEAASAPSAAPLPLLQCLVIPQPGGGWGHIGKETRPAVSPDSLPEETFEGLDSGLPENQRTPQVSFLSTPPMVRAMRSTRHRPKAEVTPAPRRPAAAGSASLAVSRSWMTSACLVLAMFAGAASAALVFHQELTAVVVQWEAQAR